MADELNLRLFDGFFDLFYTVRRLPNGISVGAEFIDLFFYRNGNPMNTIS